MFGAGYGRSHHHGIGAVADGLRGLFRHMVAAFGDHECIQARQRCHQIQIRGPGHRAAGVAGERGAQDLHTHGTRGAAILGHAAVRHGEAPRGMDCGDKCITGNGTWTVRRIEGDHIGPRGSQFAHVLQEGRDAHGTVRQVALDESDDGRPRHRAHGTHIGKAFDPHGRGAARQCGQRKGRHGVRPVHRTARNRLAGDDQAASQDIKEFRASCLPSPSD